MTSPEAAAAERTNRQLTLHILPAVAFTFVAYFSIGIPLAILPSYAHQRLGVSATIAGLLVSLQYIATFASRPMAGKLSDTIGPKQTVRYGLTAACVSGLLLVAAALLHRSLPLSLTFVALSRLALGTGESLTSTGSTMWGIGRVGTEHTARVISWNGVATYGALAISAPLGVAAEARWGFESVGIIIAAITAVSFVFASRMAPTGSTRSAAIHMGSIVMKVAPYGMALALGGIGFGVIATFITLYFAHLGWQGAALSLTIFGGAFVCARLLFSGLIDRFGGYPVTIVSMIVEATGLALLGAAHSPSMAYLGCCLSGLGFSLVFPALGVEAAAAFPAAVRGSVLGVYSAFVDLSLFLTGPMAGFLIGSYGYRATYAATAGAVALGLAIAVWLVIRQRALSNAALSSR